MNTTIAPAHTPPVKAWHDKGQFHVHMADGASLTFPANITPLLAQATDEQRNRITLLPFTLHWPEIDEDLTIESLLQLGYGR
jgi:hypothetical protein